MFENSDIYTDSTGFDGFLDVISSNYLSTKLCIEKLDSMIDDAAGGLSANTIMSHERRKLLLEHVVDRPAVRAWSIDHTSTLLNSHCMPRRQRKELFRVEEAHSRQRQEASEVVWELKNVIQDTKQTEEEDRERLALSQATPPPPLTPEDVLRPLNEIFEPAVSEVAQVLEVLTQRQKGQGDFHSPIKDSSEQVRHTYRHTHTDTYTQTYAYKI